MSWPYDAVAAAALVVDFVVSGPLYQPWMIDERNTVKVSKK